MHAKPLHEDSLSSSRKLEKMLLLERAVRAPSWGCEEKVLFVNKFQKVEEHCLPKYLLCWR